MDSEPFSTSLYKWDTRATAAAAAPHRLQFEHMAIAPPPPPPPQQPSSFPPYCVTTRPPARELLLTLEDFFQPYGIRYTMIAKIAELGFTVSTLLDMKDEELDDMMITLSQIVRIDLLVGEKYGIKAAIRAERRRYHLLVGAAAGSGHVDNTTNPLDALSQEG
ncbi:Floricaula/leafy-like protein [Thalictrum thalictroides]|uniref:Floricaula/leafy-like transcription factor n=1 Tax=Thalictrum thalictroides TaxID=46969 RepID=A0A7J6VEW8_THATH|nr:Floricaula/leafy-like protein [Thalictrum thalictroides]